MLLSIQLICPDANIYLVGWQPGQPASEVCNINQYQLLLKQGIRNWIVLNEKNSTEVLSNTNRLNQDTIACKKKVDMVVVVEET